MLKFNQSDYPDVDKYEERIRENGYIAYDREQMNRICQYETVNYGTYASVAGDIMIQDSGWKYNNASNRDAVLGYLMDCEFCPESYFNKKGSDSYSLDSKKVLQKLYDKGYAKEFLELYIMYKSKKMKCGKVRNIVKDFQQSCGTNKDGVPLSKITFSVMQQKNMRYNYSNCDVIAIPKDYNSCISVEDGYFLAWGDFAQSDFRIAYNLFIRSPENDAIMMQYDDRYEGLARIVAKAEGKKFDLEQFKEDRPLYKRLTLATMYGTRNSIVPDEAAFITKFYEFLQKCPKYVEYERRLNERANLDIPILVQSYFGHTESCPILYKKEDTVNNALNSPVQSCTSEIVILTINRLLDMFYERGYTPDDISVYYVRHDEPVFRVKESALKDIWILNQASQILVDNWTPLAMDFNYGYYYKVPDEELEEKIQKIYEQNEHNIYTYTVSEEIDTEYYPVASLCTLYAAKQITPDGKTVIALYDKKEHSVAYFLCNSTDDEEVFEYVKKSIASKEEVIYNRGHRGIQVLSKFMSGEVYYGNSLIKFIQMDNGDLLNVVKLCDYMTLRYCAKNGLTTDIQPLLQEDEQLIKTVKDLF